MQNDKLKQFLERIKKKEEEKRGLANDSSCELNMDEAVKATSVSPVDAKVKIAQIDKMHASRKYIYEDKSRRRADVRTYRKEKGKLEAVITGAPVNYYNRTEKRYRQIDNTLERTENTRSSMDFVGYENRYNSFKVRFAETTASSDMMRVEKDGYEIYFKLLPHDLLISDGSIYNRGFREVLTSKVKYADLYDGIDFDYEIRPDSIKEDITVKSYRDNYTFAFKVFTNGLDIRLSEDRKEVRFIASVSLEDTSEGDTVFTMPAAFMYDKANNKSENIIYAVDCINSGEFLVKVIPDSNWLNSEERKFPVVIDPSLLVYGDDSDIVYKIVKNYVDHSSGSDFYREENNNTPMGFFRGNAATPSDAAKLFGETELYIGFKNISRIYNGIVNVAQLNIPIYLSPYVENTAGYFEVYGITEGPDWMNKELNWDSRPEVSSEIIAFAKPIYEKINDRGGWYLKLDITSAMASKYSGFVVKGSTKGIFFNGGWYNYIYIPTANAKQNVALSITYTEKEQVRGGKSIQQSCNQAGTGSVDLFTGDISFVHEDINLEGVQLPINVAHIYNSRVYDNEADSSYKCGVGWRLNFMQTLKEKYEEIGEYNKDTSFRCFEYIDASGIRHELTTRYYNELQSTDAKEKKFKVYGAYREVDSDNPKDWSGTEISDGNLVLDLDNYTIIDEAKNKLKFDRSTGRLISITNADGKAINITYSTNNSTVTISDGNGRSVTFNYSANKLTSIKAGSNTISYTYQIFAGKSCLTKISGDFGDTLFSYNAKGILCKVTDPSGYIVEYKESDIEGYICGGYKIKCKNSEISYNADENSGAVAGSVEQLLDDITITYNAEFCAEVSRRFNGLYFTQAMDNMTMVENTVAAKKFYSFSSGGSLLAVFDDKLSQEVSYVSNKEAAISDDNITDELKEAGIILDSDRWKRSVVTQISASVLSTARILQNQSSRNPIGGNYSSTPYSLNCGTYDNLDEGGYVFTAIIAGNIISGQMINKLTDKVAENSSYLVLKVVRHFSSESKKADDMQFVKVEPACGGGSTEKLTCLPFIVDDDVTSVDLSVELNNSPEHITVTYWDLVPAAKASMMVAHDKDYAETISYSGKYGTKSRSDLSKRGNKKQTTTTRIGATSSITSVNTYLSEDSEKVTEQDDGISLIRSYTYDSNGNVIKEEVIGKNNSSLKIKKEYSYEKSGSNVTGNALFIEKDENDNQTTYDYESKFGLLSRTTLPGTNQNIDYAYSGIEGLLKEVKAIANSSNNVEETSNSFYYNLGYLTRVKHNSCTYDFTYDGFGRIIEVAVGGKTIIKSAYTECGTDIDGVEGATSKTVTAYYNSNSKTGVLCGEVLCGQALAGYSGKKSGAAYLGSLYCGQYFAAADNKAGQEDSNWQNNVYASYYNKHGELIKVRHAVNRELSDSFDSDTDYITVTDECDYSDTNRILTYVVGTTKYVYNYNRTTGEQVSSEEYEEENLKIKFENVSKDDIGRDAEIKFTLDNGDTLDYTYTYKSDYEDSISTVTLPSGLLSNTVIDGLGRLETRAIKLPPEDDEKPSTEEDDEIPPIFNAEYEYCSNKNNSVYTTPLVSKETHFKSGSDSAAYQYTYDSNNNILTVKDGSDSLLISYEYDGLNRLIRENIVGGNTTVFKYDKGGNLQFKKIYAYSAASGKTVNDLLNGTFGKTVNYGYGVSTNKDLLTSYNGSGTLEYDNYGNPKKWFKHGANNSSLGYTLQWGHVSNLTAISDDAIGSYYTYKYNDQGIRTEKVVNGVTHRYYLQGEQIIAERYDNNLIKFYYDTTGVCGFNYNGTDYYYQKNIQGDILRIYNDSGTLYAEYSYDAWGKCTIKTNVNNIATINPFRYRGYYFDTETGLYYLNARYYDSEIGRFISPDSTEYLSPETINGLNIYAYCGNNPVNRYDLNGCDWQSFLSTLERVLTGIADFGNLLVKKADKLFVSWKKFHKYNPGISFRQFQRDNASAILGTAKLGKVLNKIGLALSFATLFLDIGSSWARNYDSGSSTWVSDSVVDTLYLGIRFAIGVGITSLISTLIPIPFLGTLIGVGVSLAVDAFIQFMFESTDLLNQIKLWAADVGQSIVNGWNYFWSFAWI